MLAPKNIDISKIKLIIWDLDNTFWDGILSEGGIQRIVPDNVELIKTLSQRGIVNSICSKNDFDECRRILTDLGVWDYFVFPSIDWTPKGSRIKTIISEMQLRAPNVLFLDDEPYNLYLAKESNEGLMCGSAEELVPVLFELSKNLQVDESMKRLRQYQQLQVKVRAKKSFDSNDVFLRQSEIRVSICNDCMRNVDRIAELVSRTNQLNFTKKRDTREELVSILRNPCYQCGLVSCQDKYADYGEIGFFALDTSKNELVHFLFSCRTIGMGIEQWLYARLGFPTLHPVGAVVTSLNQMDCPDWIELTEDSPQISIETAPTKKGMLLLKGPCDISQVLPYLNNRSGIDSEFAYISQSKGNLYIEAINHTLAILQSVRLKEEEKNYLVEHIPFIDQEYFKTDLFSKEYNYVVFSLLTDYGLGLYQSRENPDIRLPFGQHTVNYTAEKNWTERIGPLEGELREQYRYFINHFDPVGRISPEELVHNIFTIRGMLPDKTHLILLNGSELEYPGDCKYWLVGREKEHKQLNAVIQEAVGQMKNCYLIDINKLLTSQDQYLDTINHYKKSVYYEIAKEIQRYTEQTGQGMVTAKKQTRLVAEKMAAQLKKFLRKWLPH